MQRTGAGWAAAQSDASAYNARSQRDTPQPEEQRSGSDGERLGWLILQNQKLNMHALLAQLVEQLTLNQRAQGSSPWKCTTKRQDICPVFFVALPPCGGGFTVRADGAPVQLAGTLRLKSMPPACFS